MKSLLNTVEKNSLPCGIKDRGARYRYVNPAMRELLALPDDFVISGCSDCDIPHPIALYASVMWEEEQRLYRQGENISLLALLPFGRENRIQPYIFNSIPHYDEKGDLCGGGCVMRGPAGSFQRYNALTVKYRARQILLLPMACLAIES